MGVNVCVLSVSESVSFSVWEYVCIRMDMCVYVLMCVCVC